ncbi:MAG: hypothetical protein ACREBS_09330, partial [Nitrososphaerales archaeon]
MDQFTNANLPKVEAVSKGGPNEAEIVAEFIKSLQEETQQLSELAEKERDYSADVVTILKQIITPLRSSFHIKPESISKSDSSISEVVLTSEGMVCVFNKSGSVA